MTKITSIIDLPEIENVPDPSVPGTEPLWTVVDVANYLRLKPETVRTMARKGELPSIKLGRRVWRFKISEVKKWLMTKVEESHK